MRQQKRLERTSYISRVSSNASCNYFP